jgi:DNA-binding transcriptional LysR family regulator
MNFSLEQLLAFVAVYEQLSFSKAAAKLSKHRTTIAQVITNLEDQLAVTLFDRVGRTVTPTEDGRLLYHYAKQALEQVRVFDKVALSLSYGSLESVTIAYPSILPHRVLADIRIKLAQDFPTMQVNFLVRNKSDIKKGIQNGDYHFGLVNIHDSTAIHSFDATFLGHIEFVPFVRKGSELAELPPEKVLSALKNSRQIVLKSLVDEGIKEKMLVSSEHEIVDQLALAIMMVREGLGWAWLPKIMSELEYVTDNIQPIIANEMKQGFKFPIALWCQHTKQVAKVKVSILAALENYIARFQDLQK